MKVSVALVFVLSLAVLGWWSGQQSEIPSIIHQEPIKIGVSLTPLSTPFYVAQKQSLFTKHGLNVEIVPCKGGVQCATLLQAGSVDYATASGTVALFNSYHHNNISLLASFVTSSNDLKLLTLESSGITDITDLEHKKVGIVKSSSSEFYFDLLLISNALQDMDVERVYLKPEDTVSAMLSYQVDAISIWEPHGYRAGVESVAPVVDLGTEGIYQLSFNLLTKSTRTKQEAVDKALLLAISEAIDWVGDHSSESIELISQELKIRPQQVKWTWDDYVFRLANDYSLLSNLQLQAHWASERSILEGEPLDVRAIIDDTSLDEINLKVPMQ